MNLFLLAVALGLLLWGVLSFNRFVRLRNQVRAAWADIDVQLRRRHDLVPNLVAAVKGYAGHEKATLELVTELRAQALSLANPAQLGEVEARLEQGITRLIALQEAYPDLKASENFAALQRDLVEVEDHLQYARRFYNGAVRDFNTILERIPDLVIGRAFGFSREDFFQAEVSEREAPSVRGMKG
jgi:LemA protein